MAIERAGVRVGLEKAAAKTSLKTAGKAAKKHAEKHPAKKHPAKKHAGKKSAKHAAFELLQGTLQGQDGEGHDQQLTDAFHHLHRAAAVISLLEQDRGGDLKLLLEQGMRLYRGASGARRKDSAAGCAFGLLRAAEHLSMAGLYSARSAYRVKVAPPARTVVLRHLRNLGPRLDRLGSPEREEAQRLFQMARELLTRAEGADHDPHLEYELTMAAEGICTALEQGI